MKIFTKIIILFILLSMTIFNGYTFEVYGAEMESENRTNSQTNTQTNTQTNISWAGGAEDFLSVADPNIKIDNDRINQPSSQIYNVLTSIGMIIAIGVGVVLGIKYMITSAEEKAKVLETMIPYIVGCIVTFGAFGIWKLLINTFYNI